MIRSAAIKLYSKRLDNIQLIKHLVCRQQQTVPAQAQAHVEPNSVASEELAAKKKMEADLKKLEKIKIPESNSFVQNLFTGVAKVDAYFPYPQVLNEEELSLIEMVTEPVQRMWDEKYPELLKIEDTETVPEDIMEMLREMGSFGIQVPVEYGGMGCNNTQYARLGEISGQYDLGIGIVMGAHQSIGYKGLVLFGTEEQKQRYLPDLASGKKMAAFALTEPDAGSDASGIKTRAVRSEDGSHWIINGSKTYISNGGFADYFTLFCKTEVKDKNGEVKDKVTAFWAPRGPGLTSGPNMKKMGIKMSNTTELWFEDYKVPHENIIGEVGEGFKVAMKILNCGRYGMGCALSGTMRRAIEMATNHANNRSQFGNKLANFTQIQEKLARMSMAHYVTQSHAYMLSGIMDNGMQDYQLEAAISKIMASDSAWFVVDEALQIFGGMGYIKDTGIEKILRDTRIFRIFEGANEILRLFVALTGIQFAGGHLKELQRALKNPMANLPTLFSAGTKRLKRSMGLELPNLQEFVHPKLHDEAKLLAKNIVAISQGVEYLLMKYKNKIVFEQMLSIRLANAVIDTYSMLVLLSRTSLSLNKNIHSADVEVNMTKVFCSEANTRISRNLGSLKAPDALKNDENLRKIAHELIENGGLVHGHPLHPVDST